MFEFLDLQKTRRLRADLTDMLANLCGGPHPYRRLQSGYFAPTEARGWFDAATVGRVRIPYVGELAAAHRFPRFARTMERVDQASRCSLEIVESLRDELRMIRAALAWLPNEGNAVLAFLQQRARVLAPAGGVDLLPDIAPQLHLPGPHDDGNRTQVVAAGRLGVPGLVKTHEPNGGNRQQVTSSCPGYRAGHLLGKQFGAPFNLNNLVPMHKTMNHPVYYQVEQQWAKLLKAGIGIEATVTVDYFRGDERPSHWHVAWVEVLPNGSRIPRKWNVTYLNNAKPDYVGKRK